MNRDPQSLLDIYRSAGVILMYMEGVSRDKFLRDEREQDLVIRRLILIGEAASRLSEEQRLALPDIAWAKIRGLRNRIVHEYDNIDLRIVWEIVQTEMPDVMSKLENVIPPEQLSILKEEL